MTCPKGVKLQLYWKGDLSQKGRQQVMDHLKVCGECYTRDRLHDGSNGFSGVPDKAEDHELRLSRMEEQRAQRSRLLGVISRVLLWIALGLLIAYLLKK